jgi:hypothetical protein
MTHEPRGKVAVASQARARARQLLGVGMRSYGVRVAGVDVGGMERNEARGLLEVKVAKPLERAVTVKFGESEHRLAADELEAQSDVDAMVERAIQVSRAAPLPERLWRYVTGGEVEKRVASRISYSEEALDDFVSEVTSQINRDPVDASVTPGPASHARSYWNNLPTRGRSGDAHALLRHRGNLEIYRSVLTIARNCDEPHAVARQR